MKTKIFKNYKDFLRREDKSINGVSPKFAKNHPSFEENNESNVGCWCCYRCDTCYGCKGCNDCYQCSGLVDGNEQYGPVAKNFIVPLIKNIHQAVFAAASAPNALDQSEWHYCDSTHCRGGWVTTLAGLEGRMLEEQTSPSFAAMQIYKASSTIHVAKKVFYFNNKESLKDMRRCAELERLAMK